jgi:4-carboxymuconolactone decarboxylase
MSEHHHATQPLDREAGAALLETLQDESTRSGWTATLDAQAPGMADWVTAAVFGGIYQRPALSLRDRQLLNLGALTALGGVDPQLAGHVRTGLRVGMGRREIAEAIVHLVPYVGLPRALAALRVAGDALDGEAGS